MGSLIDADLPLDYVEFKMTLSNKRYEAFACSEGKAEKVASGLLGPLLVHLPAANPGNVLPCEISNEKFMLQLPEDLKRSVWFTKATLLRFLHVIREPNLLKTVFAIESEISQLDEARKFHFSQYAQGQQNHFQNGVHDCSYSNDILLTPKPENQTAECADATKNELLQALDLRLMLLREELTTSFNRSIAETCSVKQIADLAAFVRHFGGVNLRNFMVKFLALCGKNLDDNNPANENMTLHRSKDDNKAESVAELGLSLSTAKPGDNDPSPAKIAQAERHSSSESEEYSHSSDEDPSQIERSRPIIRSAPARRSASPMRRIQIGRSGSRRTTALTIKNLCYIPSRDKISSNRDATENSNEGKEFGSPQEKTESSVTRMSVQDAINLFESKQKDERTDVQRWRTSTGTSIGINRSVLRRWSAGMSETFSQCAEDDPACSFVGELNNSAVIDVAKKNIEEVKQEDILLVGRSSPVKNAENDGSLAAEEKMSTFGDMTADAFTNKSERITERAASSAEWNRQKEAELNQMLTTMLESKPARYRNKTSSTGKAELPSEQVGGLHGRKRDAKLREENPRKQADKEAPSKAMQLPSERRKTEAGSKPKNINVSGKQGLSGQQSQRISRRSNSVPPKMKPSKPASPRKSSPKASPLPATRNSWPSTPSSRSVGPATSKLSGGTSSSLTPTCRKPQTAPSPIRASMKSEHPLKQKGMMRSNFERAKVLKSQEKEQAGVKGNKSSKSKMEAASLDDSDAVSVKPSFYSKVTKKSSVVPLEPKPFLRKGTGIGPGAGPVIAKTKTPQSDVTSKNSDNLARGPQENDAFSNTAQAEMANQFPIEGIQLEKDVALIDIPKCENLGNKELSYKSECEFTKTAELEIQTEDLGISPSAWVGTIDPELPLSHENDSSEIAIPSSIEPAAISSTRVHHSLSQMLQDDYGEPEIIEWGNAENPPALIYQKDSPKGLKRLLKFARRSRGEANLTGWASPSIFSEGEEDADEPKSSIKRNTDGLLRKSALHSKGSGHHKTNLSESYDGGNSRKGSISYKATYENFSAHSNASISPNQMSHKLRQGHLSTATIPPTKAARSFFSLPTFRSGKSGEAKLI